MPLAAAESVRAPRRILVSRPDSIGDAVLFGSALPYLKQKFPNSEIAIFCQTHLAAFYENCPWIHRTISFDKKAAFRDESYRANVIEHLRNFQPDLILNPVYSREAVIELILLSVGAPQIIGLHGDFSNITDEDKQNCNPLYTELIDSP